MLWWIWDKASHTHRWADSTQMFWTCSIRLWDAGSCRPTQLVCLWIVKAGPSESGSSLSLCVSEKLSQPQLCRPAHCNAVLVNSEKMKRRRTLEEVAPLNDNDNDSLAERAQWRRVSSICGPGSSCSWSRPEEDAPVGQRVLIGIYGPQTLLRLCSYAELQLRPWTRATQTIHDQTAEFICDGGGAQVW